MVLEGLVIPYVMTPTGTEQSPRNASNSNSFPIVPTSVPTNLISELLKTLSKLDEEPLRKVLAFAQSVAEPTAASQ